MKARPILFSGPMIRALMSGRKSMTRRIIKPQPPAEARDAGVISSANVRHDGIWCWLTSCDLGEAVPIGEDFRCPYGVPGDVLWCRETSAHVPLRDDDGGQGDKMGFIYRADGDDAFEQFPDEWQFLGKWTPSIHMPRRASRLTLKLTDVRVERLNSISDADAKAEGARHFPDLPMGIPSTQPARWSMEDAPPNTDHCLVSPKWAFANYWNKINGEGSWDQNPWCWAIAFEPIQRNVIDVLRDAKAAA